MRRYLAFLGIGTLFSTVEEFLTVGILKHDFPAYLFTLIVLFPAFLTFVYFASRLVCRLARRKAAQELVHFWLPGSVGILIEWFVIGLSPWAGPRANIVLVLLFQTGMFCFWATVGYAPRVFASADSAAADTRRSILRFYLPYFALVYVAVFLAPVSLRFAVMIPAIVVGYAVVAALLLVYALRFRRYSTRESVTASEGAPEMNPEPQTTSRET